MWAITRERGLQSLLFPDELPFQSGKPDQKAYIEKWSGNINLHYIIIDHETKA